MNAEEYNVEVNECSGKNGYDNINLYTCVSKVERYQ